MSRWGTWLFVDTLQVCVSQWVSPFIWDYSGTTSNTGWVRTQQLKILKRETGLIYFLKTMLLEIIRVEKTKSMVLGENDKVISGLATTHHVPARNFIRKAGTIYTCSYCIWPACLFLSMAFGKKLISGKACGSLLSGPMTLVRGMESLCLATSHTRAIVHSAGSKQAFSCPTRAYKDLVLMM